MLLLPKPIPNLNPSESDKAMAELKVFIAGAPRSGTSRVALDLNRVALEYICEVSD
jgi:hypothetical protein